MNLPDLERLKEIAQATNPSAWDLGPLYWKSGPRLHSALEPSDQRFIATFDPTTVLALLSRLEKCEGALREIATQKPPGPTASRTTWASAFAIVWNAARQALSDGATSAPLAPDNGQVRDELQELSDEPSHTNPSRPRA